MRWWKHYSLTSADSIWARPGKMMWIIYPHHAGERTLAPVREYTSERYLNFGIGAQPRSGRMAYSAAKSTTAGLASMNWIVLL